MCLCVCIEQRVYICVCVLSPILHIIFRYKMNFQVALVFYSNAGHLITSSPPEMNKFSLAINNFLQMMRQGSNDSYLSLTKCFVFLALLNSC